MLNLAIEKSTIKRDQSSNQIFSKPISFAEYHFFPLDGRGGRVSNTIEGEDPHFSKLLH
jgi:hypothetical protein